MRSVSRCATREPSATRRSTSPSASGRTERRKSWAYGRSDRGGEILAPGDERAEEPRRRRRANRRRRRLEGLSRSDHRHLPAGPGTDLRRPSDPPLARLRLIQGSQGMAAALKQIYKAKDADAGKLALEDFDESPRSERGDTFPPTIARSSSCSWC